MSVSAYEALLESKRQLQSFDGFEPTVYGAVINGRVAIGCELKETYYRQAALNLEAALKAGKEELLFTV